jgi:hypothetical protein
MWTYHTLAYAVKEGTRYASVHGKGCEAPNTCTKTVAQIRIGRVPCWEQQATSRRFAL